MEKSFTLVVFGAEEDGTLVCPLWKMQEMEDGPGIEGSVTPCKSSAGRPVDLSAAYVNMIVIK